MVLRGRIQSIIQNPILLKEWRSRTHHPFLILFSLLYLAIQGLILFVLLFIGGLFLHKAALLWSELGATFLVLSAWVEGFSLFLITPALTVGAISGERQHQTFDSLRTTTLSARQLIWGKLLSALRYPLLIVAFATVFQLLAVFTPAIHLVDVVIMQLMMTMTALSVALLGLTGSAIFRSTLGSTVFAYASLGFILIGISIMVGISSSISWEWNPSQPVSNIPVVVAVYGSHLVGSVNLPYAVKETIMIRIDNESYWAETRPLAFWGNAPEAWFPSAWYLYLFWQVVLSLGLYKLAVWQVGRIPD